MALQLPDWDVCLQGFVDGTGLEGQYEITLIFRVRKFVACLCRSILREPSRLRRR